MMIQEQITRARRILNDPECPTPGLAAFIVRDLPETAEAGLTELARQISRGNQTVSRDEIKFLLDELERAVVSGRGPGKTEFHPR